MTFADADDSASIRCRATVGVAHASRSRRSRRDRHGFATRTLPVKALIGEIGKEHGVAVNEICAAAVFMDSRSSVETLGSDIAGIRNQHDAAGLIRTALQPIQISV